MLAMHAVFLISISFFTFFLSFSLFFSFPFNNLCNFKDDAAHKQTITGKRLAVQMEIYSEKIQYLQMGIATRVRKQLLANHSMLCVKVKREGTRTQN